MSKDDSKEELGSPQPYFEKDIEFSSDRDSPSDTEKNEAITELARQYTHTSTLTRTQTNTSQLLAPIPTNFNPFLSTDNPILDPLSPEFNPRAWARHMLKIRHSDPEKYPKLNAGVSFKNLGAYGYSDGTSFQPTVFNTIIQRANDYLNLIRRRKGEKVTILKNFNGLVKSGETCVVLGRPGAYVFFFLIFPFSNF